MQKITKILFIVAFMMISTFAKSQSLAIPNGAFHVQGLYTDQRVDAYLEVENTNTADLSILINCDRSQLVFGHQTYYCWALCYDTTICNSPDALIVPGRTLLDNSFHSYVYPNGIAGTSTISYTFFDQNNPSDSISASIIFDVLTSGVDELSKGHLSAASPNPANAFTNINYTVPSLKDGRLVIYDMLGSVVKEVQLNHNQSTLLLSTTELSSGIYVYSLINDGKSVSTKKLVVAHH